MFILTPEEKKKLFGLINSNNKMIIKKELIYNKTKPEISCPHINWIILELNLNKVKNS